MSTKETIIDTLESLILTAKAFEQAKWLDPLELASLLDLIANHQEKGIVYYREKENAANADPARIEVVVRGSTRLIDIIRKTVKDIKEAEKITKQEIADYKKQ